MIEHHCTSFWFQGTFCGLGSWPTETKWFAGEAVVISYRLLLTFWQIERKIVIHIVKAACPISVSHYREYIITTYSEQYIFTKSHKSATLDPELCCLSTDKKQRKSTHDRDFQIPIIVSFSVVLLLVHKILHGLKHLLCVWNIFGVRVGKAFQVLWEQTCNGSKVQT